MSMSNSNLNDTIPPPPGAGKPGDTRPNKVTKSPPAVAQTGQIGTTSQNSPFPGGSPPPPGATQVLYKKTTAKKPGISGFKGFLRRNWLWLLLIPIVYVILFAGGAGTGYQVGRNENLAHAQANEAASLTEQFFLGQQDLQSGNYELARQRFEFILNLDPDYPGAMDALTQAMQILMATATPTAVPATVTPTPTRDLRPVEDLFRQVQTEILAENWYKAIDLLNTIRTDDATYQVAQVDRMIYISLRNRGMQKILQENNLGGGIYDLTLAERFGPLDFSAITFRNYARLYLIGSSFFEALPEQAVYYFSQVAAGAPSLRDGSGVSASARYWMSLVFYGDWLAAKGQWCDAEEEYRIALSMNADGSLQTKAENALIQCLGPSATPTNTLTLIPTITDTVSFSPTPTLEIPSLTPTPPSDTPAPATPTETPTPPAPTIETPTSTPSPTNPPPDTETPTPTDTSPASTLPLTDRSIGDMR